MLSAPATGCPTTCASTAATSTSSPTGRGTRCSSSALERAHRDSRVVDAVVGLAPEPGDTGLRRIDRSALQRIGVKGVTLLAVRPDRYVGLRHDGGDPAAVQQYLVALAA